MKISYAITVCNEYEEIQKLISTLMLNIKEQDEVVVLYDEKNGTADVWRYLRELQEEEYIKLESRPFGKHFADWKNLLTSICSGDFIFQIDADEYPNKELLETLPFLLEMNKDIDVMLVPRVNTVTGLSQDHIAKWRWSVNEKDWVNWPDYQWRIYRNTSSIKWVNRVHERLEGFKQYATLPMEEEFALYHHKDIERQEKQNKLYDTL